MKTFDYSFLSLFLLAACGDNGGERSRAPAPLYAPSMPVTLDSEFQGQYLAVLRPIHPMLLEKLKGAVTISREQDELVGDVRLSNGFPDQVFAQNIRQGSRCPTMEDDLNLDGFIDANEGEAVYGKMLIPLDADLSGQSNSARIYPLADQYGNYIYSKVTSFAAFIRDLREVDPSEEDDYVKLDKIEKLEMEERVAVIHGVPKDFILPETVQTTSSQPAFQTMPIACGKMKVVGMAPGVPDGSRPQRPASEVSSEEILSWGFGVLDDADDL